MFKRISIFFFSLCITSVALGDVQLCLEDATNAQLLKELRFRLNAPTSPVYSLPTVTCFGATMNVMLLNDAGVEATTTLIATSSFNCEKYSEQISAKVGSKIISPIMVASCRGALLERRMLKPSGVIQDLNDLNFTSSSKCDNKATEINQ